MAEQRVGGVQLHGGVWSSKTSGETHHRGGQLEHSVAKQKTTNKYSHCGFMLGFAIELKALFHGFWSCFISWLN